MNRKNVIRSSAVTSKKLRTQKTKEKFIEMGLLFCAASSVFVTGGIVYVLVRDAIPFFQVVSVWEFLTGTQWTPLFEDARFGIAPLLTGTLLSTLVAISVAVPFGTVIAIYLSEYSSHRVKEVLKPVLELLAAVPTVVYGYFAFLFVTPLLQKLHPDIGGFNVLSAGLVMGIMIVPYVSSLTEDAMRAVPGHLREAAYATGASRLQTAIKVIYPAALSGITSAYILGISRALGETMIVAIAAGMQPNLTWNPTEPAATITAFIVQVSLGDLPHGTIGYRSIYVAGLTLLLLTLSFNLLGFWFRKRYREAY